MKKNLFMLGAAIVALSSCTQDEVLNVNENRVISFESHVNKNTRAVEETTSALENFYVFGYYGAGATNVFSNFAVTDDKETSVLWTAANDYYFAAYATSNTTSAKLNNAAFAGGKLTFTEYTVNDEQDLVAAVTGPIDNSGMSNNTVNLDFKHMLSKVVFELTNSSSEYKMQVADISFNVNTKGTCVYDGDSIAWSGLTESEPLKYDAATISASGKYSVAHLVIPTTIPAGLKVDISINFLDAKNNTVSKKTFEGVELASTTVTKWLPGNVYKYLASINAATGKITFHVQTVNEWNEDTDYNTNI